MNSKNCSELKILSATLIETYGQKETENNWNESALNIRKLSNLISSDPEKFGPQNDHVKMIINVLEQSCFSERTRLALDSIELLKNIAMKIASDIDKSLYGVIISILLKACERSNKIITKYAHEAISVIIKANLNFISVTIPLVIDFGRDNCNRFVRQICIEVIKELVEYSNDPKIVDNILAIAGAYIKSSANDSCDVVRSCSRKIGCAIKKCESNPFLQTLDIENSPKNNTEKKFSALCPNANRKNSNMISVSVQKPKVHGKAQRVKIIP